MQRSQVSSRLLAHRGIWNEFQTGNSPEALTSAVEYGYGIETDLRDYLGTLVVEHDLSSSESTSVAILVELVNSRSVGAEGPIALNIKSDGLLKLVTSFSKELSEARHFYFDMSFPQMLQYARHRLPIAVRVSEFEPVDWGLIAALNLGSRWWLDAFDSDWWLKDPVARRLVAGGEVHIVSPELHGRDPRAPPERAARWRFALIVFPQPASERERERESW